MTLSPPLARYENQPGVDAGALTTSMYRQFFEEVFKPEHRLFERSELGLHYLPVANPDKLQLARLESFARVLLKAIIDERTIAVPLCSAVFKYERSIFFFFVPFISNSHSPPITDTCSASSQTFAISKSTIRNCSARCSASSRFRMQRTGRHSTLAACHHRARRPQ